MSYPDVIIGDVYKYPEMVMARTAYRIIFCLLGTREGKKFCSIRERGIISINVEQECDGARG